MGKAEKAVSLYETILMSCAEKDISDIRISAISRRSKISRGWIYKYHGSNIEDLIHDAAKYFGELFSEISVIENVANKNEWIQSQMDGLRQLEVDARKYPWIIKIYFKYKGTSNSIGRAIKNVESRYKKQAVANLQKISKKDLQVCSEVISFLVATRMGLAFEWINDGAKEKDFTFYKKLIDAIYDS